MVILAGRQAGSSTVPAKYQRVYDAIADSIRTGAYKPGEKLPSIVALAADLDAGQSTVKIALTLLGRDGWTRGQQGQATFVADDPPEYPGKPSEQPTL